MISQTIRKKFLKYFEEQKHQIIASSPVLPMDDPTLLFVNAGMNQFKDVFLGKDQRPYKRATTSQKCIRGSGKHNDLENVGHTTRHLTFFEMLGNFSFGDYFKKEAIDFAWEVVEKVFEFPKEKIFVSVYEEDDEAFELWKRHLSEKRIVRFGKKENFWEMGPTGPCGPCSELLFDRGEKFSNAPSPVEDLTGERYLEFWNLVFMQFNKDEKGIYSSLPSKSIDTGSGLERVVSLKMGVDSVFETDILRALITEQEKLFKLSYEGYLMPAFNVISDHIRTLSFAIADGVVPSNIDRGYVLRKILRRAARYGKDYLKQKKPFLAKLVDTLASLMGEHYPELKASKSRIQEILTLEEEAFFKVLEKGGTLMSQVIEKSVDKISGEDAFKLKDTYGLPLEEIQLIAKDANLSVDLEGFEKREKEAKERSRQAQKIESTEYEKNLFADFAKVHPATQFVGYSQNNVNAQVIAIVKNNSYTDSLLENEEGLIILDKTPFYAESGGQIGDIGTIQSKDGLFEVLDTFFAFGGIIAHRGKMSAGKFKKQESILATFDEGRRNNIRKNHSATHLLHFALSEVLGSHIKQAGSYVSDERLRFDFTHHKALTLSEIREVEKKVNAKIEENSAVKIYEKSFKDVEKDSKIKQFFHEKYQEKVRVIDMDFSLELCGGTHVSSLGEVGLFLIIKECSIGSGLRRIEALTSKHALNFVFENQDLIQTVAANLKTSEEKIINSLQDLQNEKKRLEQTIKKFEQSQIDQLAKELISSVKEKHEIPCIFAKVSLDMKQIKELAEKIKKDLSSICLVLASLENGCSIFISLTQDLVNKGLSAKKLMEGITSIIDGKGGGKDLFAECRGKDSSKIEKAFSWIEHALKNHD